MRFIVRDFRAVSVDEPKGPSFDHVDSVERVYRYYTDVVEKDRGYEPEKEHVVVLALDNRKRLLGWHLVSTGSVSESSCHPREVMRPLIARAASSFVLCHNHPSGDPTPSRADEAMTRRLKSASEILLIELTDHVIIGNPSPGRSPYFSFREAGLL